VLSHRVSGFLLTILICCAVLFAQPLGRLRDPVSLAEFVEKQIAKLPKEKSRPKSLQDICPTESDPLAERVFSEYGAEFTVSDAVKMPPMCIFESDMEVEKFQSDLKTKSLFISGVSIQLQSAAADALSNAVAEAARFGMRITPLDGEVAGKRSYRDTVRIWNSRFFRALDHWVAKGKISRSEAESAIALPTREQTAKVVKWEAQGYFFSSGFSRSIFNSVAPPGTSQHLSLIAFDVVEASDTTVRAIMNKHGWFQTIKADEPHFTFIGVPESELPSRGLRPHLQGGRVYWIPNVKK
jgi:hypothetical protein